ncbi:flagellar hook-length control protein FliK [Bacillus cereus]|nr:flagellar hook-length control protein FliK [Bacillus cereus]PGU70455.1 flagellar hook-length control protein FliK [Bacillus cereus]
MIEPVLLVQPSLPPQKERGLELQSKDEKSAFINKMNESGKEKPKTEETKQQEAPQEEKKQYLLVKKSLKQEESFVMETKEDKKTTEELLLAVSEQMIVIEQLRIQPELLYQYIQKIQELYKTYGNIKLEQLPTAELQQLQGVLSNSNIKNTICLEDTIQTVLEKVTMPEKMLQAANLVETETCDITKKQDEQEVIELPKIESEDHGKPELPEVDPLLAGKESLSKPHLSGTDQTVKQNGQGEKVTLPDLGKKMEAQVEALQKFVVKQERVLFQLNPEKLGTLTVFMKKRGDQIDVHVELEKHDAKKRVEMIFDELKLKLKEKEIHIQFSYSDKDEQQRKEQEQQQRQKQKPARAKQEQQVKQEFAGLLEG